MTLILKKKVKVKTMNKLGSKLKKVLMKCYNFLDKSFVTPISRAIYFLFDKIKNNPLHIEKFLSRP